MYKLGSKDLYYIYLLGVVHGVKNNFKFESETDLINHIKDKLNGEA